MKKPFVFGVLLYNQQDYIIELLESIRFQIEVYGSEYDSSIYIVDDCSDDGSVLIAKFWLKNNGYLFRDIRFVVNKCNQGTVYNYNTIINLIVNENFKIIAGDDLFASHSIFDACRKLLMDELRCYERIELKNGVINFDKKMLPQHFCDCKYSCRDDAIKRMRRGCFIHSPSTVFRKDLYLKSDARSINSLFRIFEDDPTWYSMIKKGAIVTFCREAIVIYRIHEMSVSNSVGKGINNEFQNELRKLHEIYCEESYGIEKILMKFSLNSRIPKMFDMSKYYKKINHLNYYIYSAFSKKYKKYIAELNIMIEKEQEYYNYILEQTRQFTIGIDANHPH